MSPIYHTNFSSFFTIQPNGTYMRLYATLSLESWKSALSIYSCVYPYAYPTSDRQEFLLSERYSAFEILSRLGEGKDERWKKGGKRERRGVEFSFGIERKWSVMSEDTGEKLSRLNCSRVRFFVISRSSKTKRGEEVITAVGFVALSANDSWKGDEGERGEEEKAAFARTRRPIERKFIRRLNV